MTASRFRTPRNLWRRLASALFGGLLISTLGLTGCGSGEGTDQADSGQVVIGLTDAQGDFASYTVEVLSIKLTKANGEVVETLPLTTRVDFARYTDMTEFLTAASVPSGVYTQGTLILDYGNADIWVEDATGQAVQVRNIVDGNGNPVSAPLDVTVHLDDRNALPIVPGVPAHLTLDFDLETSNRVVFGNDGPTLTVEPVLHADTQLATPKPHRLRGPLKSVDVDAGTFELIMRPFVHALSDHRNHFGTLTVATGESTVYEIDGQGYEGPAGLAVLDTLPTFSAVVAIGDLKADPRRFEAREVYAGSSVPGGDLDVVTGNVIARVGNVLTVKGATLIRAHGSAVFNDEVTVRLSDSTTVRRQLSRAPHTIGDISVGQRLMVFGTLTGQQDGHLELDASNAYARMLLTTLRGTVVGTVVIQIVPTPPQPFVIDLQSINGRRAGLFDFTGTGTDPANDAEPAHYEIETGTLDLSHLADGAPVKVRGFVRPFGQAPADFQAQTVSDLSSVRAVMGINWEPATAAPFVSLSAEGATLNLEGVGLFHHITQGQVLTDVRELTAPPSLVPGSDGKGIFRILKGGTVRLHTTFAGFAADMQAGLDAGGRLKGLVATGAFDGGSATLTARSITCRLE